MSSLGALRGASPLAMKQIMAVRLRAAAEIIAVLARAKSAGFSTRIPASIKVIGGTSGVWITAGGPGGKDAPNAYPFETGARHPLFGLAGDGRPGDRAAPGKGHWYPQPKRPFLEEAALEGMEPCAAEFAKVLDDWAKQLDLA
jgi:hypothetical protein